MSKKIAVFVCLVGLSLAGPLERLGQIKAIEEEEVLPSVGQFPGQDERQAAIIGVLGSALAPIVGAVVGPILTNLANGFVGALTGNRPGNSGSRPSFDAYMIQVPGAEGPYMLLTQETALGGVEGPYRAPLDASFDISPIGKVHVKPNPVTPTQLEKDVQEKSVNTRGPQP